MATATEFKISYLEAFSDWEKSALVKDPFWIQETREKALAHFGEIGFPTSKDEAWKHTDLDPLFKISFALKGDRQSKAAVSAELKSLGFDIEKAHLMVFVNGHFCQNLSALGELPRGVKIRSLIESLSDGPLKRQFGHILPFENRPFVALNYAYFTDGLFLHVAKGQRLEKPLHVVYLSSNSGQPTQSHVRNLLLMEEDAHASVIEHYWGNNLKPYFTNVVTKVSLDKGASLDHTKIQQESDLAHHIGVLAALQNEGSRLASRVFSFGGMLGRSEIETVLAEKRAECLLEGLTLSNGKQDLDIHTFVDHLSPACKSEQTFKAVADKSGTALFDGRVLVRENAQKTDARQSNKNLELSKDAKIYSKPQLQIYADDVKCSHGSATGQLDEEALFYFQSRGISREEAKRTLVYAFAGEMVDRLSDPYLQAPIRRMVEEWMEGKS
jgi:Fe-S cluster assembly protein SufD